MLQNITVTFGNILLLALFLDLGYNGIMISRIEFQWRKKDEPDQLAELVIRDALKKAGYTVGHIATQGIWDEDKPKFAHGKWDETRLPHEEIVK